MAAAIPSKVEKIEISQVAPPKGSIAETSLPLTFFDVLWLASPPIRQIFFFKFPGSKADFLTTILPNLKRSLSLALQHFYPLAGTLTLSPQTEQHQIRYVPGDSVRLTVAESDTDFRGLVSDHPRETAQFHPLFTKLPESDLISFQLTVFPNSGGISIGLTLNHVAADGRSFHHFIKHWASISRLGEDYSESPVLPIYDRTLIADPRGLKRIFLDQYSSYTPNSSTSAAVGRTGDDDKVLATFVLSRAQIEGLRARVHVEGRCSPFVLTCAHVWVCLTKAQGDDTSDKKVHFGVPMDCRTRMDPPIPDAYFGNCVGLCRASAKGSDLGKGDFDQGLSVACEAIRGAIRRSIEGPLIGADGWIPRIFSTRAARERFVAVSSSPIFRVYDSDFGFGRPVKVEFASIAEGGAISLEESRDGAAEIGLALPMCELKRFSSLWIRLVQESGGKRIGINSRNSGILNYRNKYNSAL